VPFLCAVAIAAVQSLIKIAALKRRTATAVEDNTVLSAVRAEIRWRQSASTVARLRRVLAVAWAWILSLP